MNRLYRILMIATIAFLIISCGGELRSAILDSECIAPCWRNINPGVTLQQEAHNSILLMEDIDRESVRVQPVLLPKMGDMIYWNFKDEKELNGSLAFGDGKVQMVAFNVAKPLSVSQIITKIGEPTLVYAYLAEGPGVMMEGFMIYPEKGICLVNEPPIILKLFEPQEFIIESSTTIQRVIYLNPSLEKGQYEIGCLRGINEQYLMNRMQKWKGFGNYKIDKFRDQN